MELAEWAKLQEELIKAQLSVIRAYVKSEEPGEKRRISPPQRMSQIGMITDILLAEGAPLHVSDIIRRVGKQYGVELDRESMVSALTKKVKKGVTFVRTGPNIFGLKEQQR